MCLCAKENQEHESVGSTGEREKEIERARERKKNWTLCQMFSNFLSSTNLIGCSRCSGSERRAGLDGAGSRHHHRHHLLLHPPGTLMANCYLHGDASLQRRERPRKVADLPLCAFCISGSTSSLKGKRRKLQI